MALGKIEYDIRTPTTIVAVNAVGVTSDATLRPNANLPNTLSTGGSDANTIYLDPVDGDDADNGTTFVLAVKTFSRALTLVTASRHTVHISSTILADHVLNETESRITYTRVFNTEIQCEEGATAKIFMRELHYTNGGTRILGLNGVGLIADVMEIDSNTATSGVDADFCEFSSASNIYPTLSLTGSNNGINNCVISALGSQNVVVWNTLGGDMDECIFIGSGTNDALYYTGTAFSKIGVTACIFDNVSKAMHIASTYTSVGTLTDFVDCIFNDVGTLYDNDSATDLDIAVTNSLINVGANGDAVTTDSTNIRNVNPLFLDQANTDYRLMHTGRLASSDPDEYFPITSEAVGIGTAGRDAGAWDHTYTPATELKRTFTFPSDNAFDKIKLSHKRNNYQEFYDITGKFHAVWDNTSTQIELELGSDVFAGADYSVEIMNMVQSRGFKRFYPNGDDGIAALTGAGGSQGYIFVETVTSTRIRINIADLPISWAAHDGRFNGWVVKLRQLTGPSNTGYYRVIDTDLTNQLNQLELYFTLEFVSGDTVDNDGGITVMYLPVQIAQGDANLVSEYHSEDETSAIFKAFHIDTNAVSEWHARKLVLMETSES